MADSRNATKPQGLFSSFGHGKKRGTAVAAAYDFIASPAILAIKVILLLSVLVCHFLTRQHTAHKGFGQSNYPECYRVSLMLLAGRGFHELTWNESADPPEVKPIVEFFNLQRPKISPEELAAFLHNGDVGIMPANSFEKSRILDICVTAFVWKVFGISWPVYYVFSSLASTGTCLLIFFITRKLAGSYWAGICASILFLASAFENHYGVRSLRDISPLWFGTLAFAFFICVVDYFRSSKWNYLWLFILGIVAMVGRGWRADVVLLIPFLFLGLVIYLTWRHRSWIQVVLGGSLFLGGAWSCDRLIRALCPGEPSRIVFHIALYGDSTRCNLTGLENSFQIGRDDIQTIFNSWCYNEGKHPDHPLAINPKEYQALYLDFSNKEYGLVCQDMFIGTLKYHLYQYLRSWPEFYFQALSSFPKRPDQYLAYLHLLGILTLILIGADKVRGGLLALFSPYYSVAWFAVLPEQKHLGQLLLPLTVIGGIGLWGLARACCFLLLRRNSADLPFFLPRSFWLACGVALATIGCWALACALAYPYSLRHRQNLLNDIRALAVQGQDAPATIKDRRVFSKFLDPDATVGEPRSNVEKIGYLLTIQAASDPGYLTCRHVHFPTKRLPGRTFTTRHKLYPNKLQYFAVSCFHAAKYGDDRPYACTVTLNPAAWILSSKRLDLSSWKKLPFSTVFSDDEPATPGSPVVGRFSANEAANPSSARYSFNDLSTEVAYSYPWETLNVLGLPTEQNFEYPGFSPVRLALDRSQESEVGSQNAKGPSVDLPTVELYSDSRFLNPDSCLGTLRPHANFEEANQSGLPMNHWFPGSGVTFSASADGTAWNVTAEQSGMLALYSPLRASDDGIYLFKLRYRPGAGDLSLGALPVAKDANLRQTCRTTQEGEDAVLSLEAKLKAGESFQLGIIYRPPAKNRRCQFTLKEIQAYRENYASWELSRKE